MARRQSEQQPRALVAAAKRVGLADKRAVKMAVKSAATWQNDAWAYFDQVPEIKFGHLFLGNAFAKLRLIVGVIPKGAEPDSDPIPVDDEKADVRPEMAAAAKAELARLRSQIGGQAAILQRLNTNLETAAEAYLVGYGARPATEADPSKGIVASDATAEDWNIRSISEVMEKGGKVFIKAGPDDTKGRELDPELDTIVRIWMPHAQWLDRADCNMRALLGECKTLQVLSQQVMAEAMSHQSAGILKVPSELSFGPENDEPESAEDPDADPFIRELLAALTDPIEDPSSAASVMPLVVRGQSEHLAALEHLTLGRTTEGTEAKIEARIERIARGMNLPIEVIKGHAATTFANAEQIDQDTFEDYLQPRCGLVVDALTVGFLHPNLRETFADDPDVERVVVWYDASRLVREPNIEANAPLAHARYAISDQALRKALGFPEDDAPDALEVLVRAALNRGALGDPTTVTLLEQLANEAGVTLPDPSELSTGGLPAMRALGQLLLMSQEQRAAASQPAAQSLPVLVAARPRKRMRHNVGRDLMELDRDLRTRLLVAANDSMNRALERANSRLRSKANGMRDALRTVELARVGATLHAAGQLTAAATEDALEGAWEELEHQFMQWGSGAQRRALELASKVASGLTMRERDALQLRQADDLRTAWAWMREALQSLAGDRLFDPSPLAPALGEFDPSMRVPTGLVRQALARAGGADALVTNGEGGAWLALTDAGTRPAGGIGTGDFMRGVFRDEGVSIEGYVWEYGPAFRARPFEPHQDLDGATFQNFDDPVLANTEGWPEVAFFLPGDHDGCVCDVAPTILTPDEAEAS